MGIIKEKCILCMSCLTSCPNNLFDVEGLSIKITKNPTACKNCKKLCIKMCPTGAIIPE